jgi:hypothetical protein
MKRLALELRQSSLGIRGRPGLSELLLLMLMLLLLL